MKENNTDLQDGKHCLQGDVMPALRKFGFLKRGWLFVLDLFASDGASFRSSMEYCDEQRPAVLCREFLTNE